MQVAVNSFKLIEPIKEDFIHKGVVNLPSYLASNTRIMIVLKSHFPLDNLFNENDKDGWLSSNPLASRRLGLICWAIQNNFNSWTDVADKYYSSEFIQSLYSIAFVAIPKNSDLSVTRKPGSKEKHDGWVNAIKEHIDIYKPDVVIFCGTHELFANHHGQVNNAVCNPKLKRPYAYHQHRVIVDALDPDIKSSDLKYYEDFKRTYNSVLNYKPKDFAL